MAGEQQAAIRQQVAGGDQYPAELHRPAAVTAVASDGTVTIELADSNEAAGPCAALDSYDPTVGDKAWVLLRGADALVLGWQADGVTQRTLPAGIGPIPYTGTAAPPGWLLSSGQTVSRTVYARLFAVIGTSHGSGDGSTTFTLPNPAGRFLVGVGTLGSHTYSRAGTGGAATHTLTTSEMPSHSHTGDTTSDGSHQHGQGAASESGIAAGSGGGTAAAAGNHTHPSLGNHTHDLNIDNAGSGSAHENRPPYLAENFVIST